MARRLGRHIHKFDVLLFLFLFLYFLLDFLLSWFHPFACSVQIGGNHLHIGVCEGSTNRSLSTAALVKVGTRNNNKHQNKSILLVENE
jgi:hypothetical protein